MAATASPQPPPPPPRLWTPAPAGPTVGQLAHSVSSAVSGRLRPELARVVARYAWEARVHTIVTERDTPQLDGLGPLYATSKASLGDVFNCFPGEVSGTFWRVMPLHPPPRARGSKASVAAAGGAEEEEEDDDDHKKTAAATAPSVCVLGLGYRMVVLMDLTQRTVHIVAHTMEHALARPPDPPRTESDWHVPYAVATDPCDAHSLLITSMHHVAHAYLPRHNHWPPLSDADRAAAHAARLHAAGGSSADPPPPPPPHTHPTVPWEGWQLLTGTASERAVDHGQSTDGPCAAAFFDRPMGVLVASTPTPPPPPQTGHRLAPAQLFADRSIWIADRNARALRHIDLRRDRVTTHIAVDVKQQRVVCTARPPPVVLIAACGDSPPLVRLSPLHEFDDDNSVPPATNSDHSMAEHGARKRTAPFYPSALAFEPPTADGDDDERVLLVLSAEALWRFDSATAELTRVAIDWTRAAADVALGGGGVGRGGGATAATAKPLAVRLYHFAVLPSGWVLVAVSLTGGVRGAGAQLLAVPPTNPTHPEHGAPLRWLGGAAAAPKHEDRRDRALVDGPVGMGVGAAAEGDAKAAAPAPAAATMPGMTYLSVSASEHAVYFVDPLPRKVAAVRRLDLLPDYFVAPQHH